MADKHLLTEAEAKAVQGAMMANTIVYIAIAVVAHLLVWNWRPWFAAWGG
jgi:light-harvesting complex 1 beta chain